MKNILLFTLSLFCAYTVRAQVLPGVIAHWAMNGNAHDTSGNGHDGHLYNVVQGPGIDGGSNHSYYFNGTNSMIGVPYSSAFNLSKFTICAVVKPEGFNTGLCQGNTILQRGKTNPGIGNYYMFMGSWEHYRDCYIFDSTKELFSIDAEGRDDFSSGTLDYGAYVTRDTWYKVVAVFNDTDYKMYVNGVFMGAAVLTKQGPLSTSTDSITIGFDAIEASAGYPYPFTGYIDDVILYNRVLNDSEIAHYNDTCGKITLQPNGTQVQEGGDVTFSTGSSIVGATYQWQEDDGSGFVNLTNSSYYSGVYTPDLTIHGVHSGSSGVHYRCIVSNTWGCTDTTQPAVLTTTGVNSVTPRNSDIHIVPNPTKGQFSVNIHQTTSNLPARIQIINTLGQVIFDESKTGKTIPLDISSYAKGLYFIKVICGDDIVCKQLIKL